MCTTVPPRFSKIVHTFKKCLKSKNIYVSNKCSLIWKKWLHLKFVFHYSATQFQKNVQSLKNVCVNKTFTRVPPRFSKNVRVLKKYHFRIWKKYSHFKKLFTGVPPNFKKMINVRKTFVFQKMFAAVPPRFVKKFVFSK